jgi:CRISPR/Cas system-associated protein Cas10 (large subunit of type III CRISPR-Cas system)
MIDLDGFISSCDEMLRQTGAKPNRARFGIEVAKALNEDARRNGREEMDLSIFPENGDSLEFFVSVDKTLTPNPVSLIKQVKKTSKPYFRQNERY